MPANTDPIYSRLAQLGFVAVTQANTSTQGGGTIGTDIFLAFTADSTNGSFVQYGMWVLAESTLGLSANSVGSVFISTQASGATTSSNTHLYRSVALPAQTPSTTVAMVPIIVPFNFSLEASQTLLVTNTVAPNANQHWKFVVVAGKY